MEKIKLFDCCFHDSEIGDVDYSDHTLTIRLSNVFRDDSYHNLEMKFRVEDGCFSIYRVKRYPHFHKVSFKGKEISLNLLRSLFIKGYKLFLIDISVSSIMNTVILDCDIFPSPKKAGVCKKILIELTFYEYDYCTLEEKTKGAT